MICSLLFIQCGRRDLNPYASNMHKILSLARLPVPTLPHIAFMEKFLRAMNI